MLSGGKTVLDDDEGSPSTAGALGASQHKGLGAFDIDLDEVHTEVGGEHVVEAVCADGDLVDPRIRLRIGLHPKSAPHR